jgi:hypothetical protein
MSGRFDFNGIPKYAKDAISGVSQYEWRSKTYTAPAVADPDYFVAAFEPTDDGEWYDIAPASLLQNEPDVFRNITMTKVDADSSGSVWIKVWGIDQFENETIEILRASAGELTIVGQVAWSYVSKIAYKATGDTAGDTMSVGTGDVLGLPLQIGSDVPYEDVRRAISDTAGSPIDELASVNTVINKEYSTIEFVDNDPNGTKLYMVELQPTPPSDGGVLPVRPRGNIVITTN